MIVEAFIPDWPGPKQHATALRKIIAPFCPVTILGNPMHYFNDQWKAMRERFKGDIALWAMADIALPDDFAGMFAEGVRILSRGDVGWYAPDVAWTFHTFDRSDSKKSNRMFVWSPTQIVFA